MRRILRSPFCIMTEYIPNSSRSEFDNICRCLGISRAPALGSEFPLQTLLELMASACHPSLWEHAWRSPNQEPESLSQVFLLLWPKETWHFGTDRSDGLAQLNATDSPNQPSTFQAKAAAPSRGAEPSHRSASSGSSNACF